MTTALKVCTKVFVFFLFLSPVFSFAQQTNTQSGKNKFYEFNITSKLSAQDAQKLDATMLERKGILDCHTDASTGRIVVKVIPQIDFNALRTVVNYAGFECNEENLVVRDE